MSSAVEPGADRAAAWDVLLGWLGDGAAVRAVPARAADWQAVAELAIELRLGPRLFHRWRAARLALPAAVEDRLREADLAASMNTVAAIRTLARVIDAFDNPGRGAGIRAVVLKGLALSETVYPMGEPRPMADLDLLVQRADVDRGVACLERLGYRAELTHHREYDRRFGGEVLFLPADGKGLPVELHWALLDYEWSRSAMRVPVETWLGRAEPLIIGPVRTWRLAPEDTLVYLALHLGIHHTYDGPYMLLDLDRLIRCGPALDWDAVVREARGCRVRRCLYFALEFTRQMFQTPIPEQALNALQPPGYVRAIVGRLADPQRARQPLGPQAARLLHFMLVDRSRDQLAGLVRVFFPGCAWIAARYEAQRPLQILLYGAWHPLRVARLGLKALGQLAGARLRPTTLNLQPVTLDPSC